MNSRRDQIDHIAFEGMNLTEQWLKKKSQLRQFRNLGVNFKDTPYQKFGGQFDEKEVHFTAPDEVRSFSKTVDGKTIYIEDKVIFP